MARAHSPKIVTNDLVLCLDAGNIKSYPGSGTTWTDLSSNGNNGTLINGTTYNASNGGCFNFDGVDDGISIGPVTLYGGSTGQNLTQEAWVYATSFTSVDGDTLQMIIQGGQSGLNYDLAFSSGRARVRAGGASFGEEALSAVLSVGTWYHITGVYENQQYLKLYVNGNLSGTYEHNPSTNPGAVIPASPSVRLGQYDTFDNPDVNAFNLNGKISIVKIYNRALTAQEIKQNFNALRGRFGL